MGGKVAALQKPLDDDQNCESWNPSLLLSSARGKMPTEEELQTPLTVSDGKHGIDATDSSSHAIPQHETSFMNYFINSKAAMQIVLICILVALGIGSTVGVVPSVVADRYARLNYGYNGKNCSSFNDNEMPNECLNGFDDAQNAAAISSFGQNMLRLIMGAVVGSISDTKGRKGILSIAIFLSSLSAVALLMLQLIQSMNPIWYYAAVSSSGLVNGVSICFSALSDIMPPVWRAPSYALLLTAFYVGLAISPWLAVFLNHLTVIILGVGFVLMGLFCSLFSLHETLPVGVMEKATRRNSERMITENRVCFTTNILLRPVKDLSILNRDRFFRLVSVVAFLYGMVSSSDRTLVVYYIESQLEFDDRDIAIFFLINGILSIFVQGILLKQLIDCTGERFIVIFSFFCGTIHNFLYGIAKSKTTIYFGVTISAFTSMSLATISSMVSYNVDEAEQGRIQGALFALISLADALGPVLLRVIYERTKDGGYLFGNGSMFIFASLFYVVGSFFACTLPPDQANSRNIDQVDESREDEFSNDGLHHQDSDYITLIDSMYEEVSFMANSCNLEEFC